MIEYRINHNRSLKKAKYLVYKTYDAEAEIIKY